MFRFFFVLLFVLTIFISIPHTLWPRPSPHLQRAQNGNAHTFYQFLNIFLIIFPIINRHSRKIMKFRVGIPIA